MKTRHLVKDPLWVAILFLLCCAAFGVIASVVYDSADTQPAARDGLH